MTLHAEMLMLSSCDRETTAACIDYSVHTLPVGICLNTYCFVHYYLMNGVNGTFIRP